MSDISTAATALLGALREESRLCTELLQLTGREEQAIVAADVSGLTALTEEKERLLELLGALETERMTALTAIGLATGQDAAALSLTEVAALVPTGARTRLLQEQATIRVAAEALAQATRHNAELLRASRELVDRWVQYLRTIISGSLTYGADGNAQGDRQRRVVDRSA